MINKVIKLLVFISLVFLLIHVGTGVAQEELNKEVKVVKPYEPSVSDAFKINQLPVINDTLKLIPEYEYIVNTKQFYTGYQTTPIKPARMVGEPLVKLYRSYFKAGIGSNITPLAEINISSLRSREYSLGVFAKHMSSHGKVRLRNDERVPAGYSENKLRVYGKKIYENGILSGGIGYNGDKILNYGYNPVIDTVLSKDDIKHRYHLFYINALYQTTYNDSLHLNQKYAINYGHFSDNFDIEENILNFQANLSKYYEGELIGGDIEMFYHDRGISGDSIKPAVFRISPWMGLFGKKWRVLVGLNFFTNDGSGESNFYPRGNIQYDIIKHYLIPYAEVGGKLEINNYRKIASENMFALPGLYVENTDHKMIIGAGVKGNFSPDIYYNFKATYSIVDNMYFYVNDVDNTDSIGNYFNVVYDNIELNHYFGELGIKASDKLDLCLQVNLYKYKMNDELKPWHKSLFDFTISGKYNLQNKIIVDLDVFMKSKTYAKSYDPALAYITLDGLFDCNIGAEYRYSKVLSGFVQLNNLTGMRYERWNQFPQQRFNLMVGLTYAL